MRYMIVSLFLLVSCAGTMIPRSLMVPRNLRGSWVNAQRSFRFTRDSVYVQESRPAQVGCVVEKKRDPVSRLSLVVVNKGDDYDLAVAVPYAIFKVRKDTLWIQRVSVRGIRVTDLQYFPWPTEFGSDSIHVFLRK